MWILQMMLDDSGHQWRVHTAALWSSGVTLMVMVIFQLDKVSLNPVLVSIYLPELDAESQYGVYLHGDSSFSLHMNTELKGSP